MRKYLWAVVSHQFEGEFAAPGELQQRGGQRRILRVPATLSGSPQSCPLSESFLVLLDPPFQLG